jgi:zinc transporter 1/2/3
MTGIASTFAGGVFLGVGMLHLLPESAEMIEDFFKANKPAIPIAYVLVIVGYSIILLIEKVIVNSYYNHEEFCKYKAVLDA